jgi:hypothetical protein
LSNDGLASLSLPGKSFDVFGTDRINVDFSTINNGTSAGKIVPRFRELCLEHESDHQLR